MPRKLTIVGIYETEDCRCFGLGTLLGTVFVTAEHTTDGTPILDDEAKRQALETLKARDARALSQKTPTCLDHWVTPRNVVASTTRPDHSIEAFASTHSGLIPNWNDAFTRRFFLD